MNRQLSRAREEANDNCVLKHVDARANGETLFSLAKYDLCNDLLQLPSVFWYKLEARTSNQGNP